MIATVLWACAAFGLASYLFQVGWLVALRCRKPAPGAHLGPLAPLSVLKPLCGVDDELEANLASFLEQRHPEYEVLLGCRSEADPAWPVARALAQRHPDRVRAVLQQGEPGLNPKVNQLLTLGRAARHDHWVISDSNVRVGDDYLASISRHLADPQVGLVTHLVVGSGGITLGSRLDNLHLTSGISVGIAAAKAAFDQDLVVGKSMALRRRDLQRLGGFESVKDVLAEDFVLGRRMAELGLAVVQAADPVSNISLQATVSSFLSRYQRWAVMQRQAGGLGLYLAQSLLHPSPWAALAHLLSPSRAGLLALGLCVAIRSALSAVAHRSLGRPAGWREMLASPLVEALATVCWLRGLTLQQITWRGTALRVHPGTQLEAIAPPIPWKPEPSRSGAR